MLSLLKSLKGMLRRARMRHINTHLAIQSIRSILIEEYTHNHMYANTRYQNPKRLNTSEFQVYSQHGEDGIIEEIFKRLGAHTKLFVEIGVQDGLECNTTYLIIKGWSGYWLDSSRESMSQINNTFRKPILKRQLQCHNVFITAENVQQVLRDAGIPMNFDLLSIDIDGNDYWVWKALTDYAPRVAVIEYNAMFRPNVKWVMEYNPDHSSAGTSYFGASLKSLELLGRQKGYKLVGCNFHGVNAFFVREDVVGDKFCEPFTAENHYEPIRYHLSKKDGLKRDFGPCESI